MRVFIVTVSDSRTEVNDSSGLAIRKRLEEAGHELVGYRIITDTPAEVAALVRRISNEGLADAVLLNGGTGIARRDSTYEAIAALLDKRLDGFGELFRMLSYAEIGAAAMLSRACAGIVGKLVVFSMPGSTAACTLALEKLVLPEMAHIVGEVRK